MAGGRAAACGQRFVRAAFARRDALAGHSGLGHCRVRHPCWHLPGGALMEWFLSALIATTIIFGFLLWLLVTAVIAERDEGLAILFLVVSLVLPLLTLAIHEGVYRDKQ